MPAKERTPDPRAKGSGELESAGEAEHAVCLNGGSCNQGGAPLALGPGVAVCRPCGEFVGLRSDFDEADDLAGLSVVPDEGVTSLDLAQLHGGNGTDGLELDGCCLRHTVSVPWCATVCQHQIEAA
jgi:hypothetical protein